MEAQVYKCPGCGKSIPFGNVDFKTRRATCDYCDNDVILPRQEVTSSDKASAPGSPPHTRQGLLKQSLLFGVDSRRESVVIGPAESIIGTAMVAHEYGGTYRKRRYPKRPLMGPTLEKTANKLPALWEKSVK